MHLAADFKKLIVNYLLGKLHVRVPSTTDHAITEKYFLQRENAAYEIDRQGGYYQFNTHLQSA